MRPRVSDRVATISCRTSGLVERNTLFEMNPNLVETLVAPPRPLSTQFIDDWAHRLDPLPDMDKGLGQAIANYVEAVGRLTSKSEQLAERVGFFVTPTSNYPPSAADQHEVYDLYEGYFRLS